jgi:rfaE bifunctional protein kinase chain/domain/rfaE bifunctional protein nucleotidyltransferase chain/domain
MNANDKIVSLERLASLIDTSKKAGGKIVHCHGVFDVLHVGHIRYFKEARQFGDVLVVTLTPDQYVNKGPDRPVFNQHLRAEMLASFSCVDFVAINEWPTAVETIKMLKPDFYVKGPDYKDATKDISGGISLEESTVREVGGEIKFTSDITFSSSSIINNHFDVLSDDVKAFLESFKKQFKAADIFRRFETLRDLRVTVIGEAILDEYVYTTALGKSSKEAILAMKYNSREIHAGGALAVANHIADFCKEVNLLTYVGAINSRKDFILKSLKDNVVPMLIDKSDSPTIVKRRYVESYMVQKLLEIYEMNDKPISEDEENLFLERLTRCLVTSDVVIVNDFGHGLLTKRLRKALCESKAYLAVNTQINAANIGFHAISKYPRANYISIHEGELRLDQREREGDIRRLVENLARKLDSQMIMITRGKNGSILYHRDGSFYECPSLAVKVVDRIGAGDAVFGLTSMFAAKEFPPEMINFVGNMIGAQAVTIVGNQRSIDRLQLLKSIETLLK